MHSSFLDPNGSDIFLLEIQQRRSKTSHGCDDSYGSFNGTSRDVLDLQYENALAKLRDAVKALEDASPNARDYYLQGPDADLPEIKLSGTREHRK